MSETPEQAENLNRIGILIVLGLILVLTWMSMCEVGTINHEISELKETVTQLKAMHPTTHPGQHEPTKTK